MSLPSLLRTGVPSLVTTLLLTGAALAQESTQLPAPPATAAGAALPPSSDQPVERSDLDPSVEGARKRGPQGEPEPPEGQLAQQLSAVGPATAQAAPPSLKLGAGLILWYYQPFLDGAKNRAESFFARLSVDAKKGIWGLHLEPRFRDTRQRSFEDGPVFLQEAYLSAAPGPVTVKVGKAYSMLGLFWDNSFYGNVQVYDGLKLAPDYGVSVEALHALSSGFALGYTLQYFIVDGRTNVSLPNRDIVSVPDGRRRNAVVARIDPELRFGGKKALRLGLSGQLFEADLPGGDHTVLRGAVDTKLVVDGFGLWGEYLYQSGRHVTDHPVAGAPASASAPASPGRASSKNHYVLVGAEYTYAWLTGRMNASYASYTDVDVQESFFTPALGIKPIEELLLLVEYVHWRRHADGPDSFVDRSLNVTAHGFF